MTISDMTSNDNWLAPLPRATRKHKCKIVNLANPLQSDVGGVGGVGAGFKGHGQVG